MQSAVSARSVGVTMMFPVWGFFGCSMLVLGRVKCRVNG